MFYFKQVNYFVVIYNPSKLSGRVRSFLVLCQGNIKWKHQGDGYATAARFCGDKASNEIC